LTADLCRTGLSESVLKFSNPGPIAASYRTTMHRLKMHPDLSGAHEQAALINEAFATLTGLWIYSATSTFVEDLECMRTT